MFLTICSWVAFLTHFMVGAGCPVALQSTDPDSPGTMVSLLGTKSIIGRSENDQQDKQILN